MNLPCYKGQSEKSLINANEKMLQGKVLDYARQLNVENF